MNIREIKNLYLNLKKEINSLEVQSEKLNEKFKKADEELFKSSELTILFLTVFFFNINIIINIILLACTAKMGYEAYNKFIDYRDIKNKKSEVDSLLEEKNLEMSDLLDNNPEIETMVSREIEYASKEKKDPFYDLLIQIENKCAGLDPRVSDPIINEIEILSNNYLTELQKLLDLNNGNSIQLSTQTKKGLYIKYFSQAKAIEHRIDEELEDAKEENMAKEGKRVLDNQIKERKNSINEQQYIEEQEDLLDGIDLQSHNEAVEMKLRR